MAEKAKPAHGPGVHGKPGKGPRVENPGKIIRRLMAYVMRKYAFAVVIVMACIIYTAYAYWNLLWLCNHCQLCTGKDYDLCQSGHAEGFKK